MAQYLVAIYHTDDYDLSVETEAMIEEIHALNRELIAAGARKFACGLSPASNARSLRKQPDGKVLVTDGPYLETKERSSQNRSISLFFSSSFRVGASGVASRLARSSYGQRQIRRHD